MSKAVTIKVTGRVQGGAFRWYAVQEAERHPRVGRVEQTALALEEEQVAVGGALQHQPLPGASSPIPAP